MAESDNILTKLQDPLVYLIPQLNKFPRDQKFVLEDRIEHKLLAVQEDCLRAYYSREKRGQAAAKTKLGLTPRRRGTRRNAEKKNSLRISATLCASALNLRPRASKAGYSSAKVQSRKGFGGWVPSPAG